MYNNYQYQTWHQQAAKTNSTSLPPVFQDTAEDFSNCPFCGMPTPATPYCFQGGFCQKVGITIIHEFLSHFSQTYAYAIFKLAQVNGVGIGVGLLFQKKIQGFPMVRGDLLQLTGILPRDTGKEIFHFDGVLPSRILYFQNFLKEIYNV